MIIYDQKGNVVDNYNPAEGHIVSETRLIHHDAVAPVTEVGHYETVAEYPNGGKDVRWVIEIPSVVGCAAWDEQVTEQTFIPYTKDELSGNVLPASMPSEAERLAAVEAAVLDLVLGGGIGG